MLPLMMLMMGGNQGPNQNMNLNPSPKLLSHFLSYLGQFKSKSHIQGHPQKVEKQSISFEKLDGISDLIVRVRVILHLVSVKHYLPSKMKLDWGSKMSSLRDGLSTPYRETKE